MQIAVLILFATREIGLSAGAIGVAYACGGLGCVLASMSAQRLSARFGIGPVNVHGLILDGSARNHRLAGRTGCLPIKPKRPADGPTSAKATAPGAS